jgi:purine catabolism regulator
MGTGDRLAVPLRDLLDHPELGLVLRTSAGAAVDDLRISWVSTTELDDPTPFLRGSELVLTTGLSWTEADAAKVEDFVERLVAVPVAAIGFGTGLRHETVPAALLSAAIRHGVAVIEVPYETPFVQLSHVVAEGIFAQHYAAKARLLQAHDSLARALLSGDGLPSLVRQLQHLVLAPVCVVDSYGAVLAQEPAGTTWPLATILARRGEWADFAGRDGLTVARIDVDRHPVAYLCTLGGSRAHDVLPFAVSLVGLELARLQAIRTGRRELVGQVIDDLAHGVIADVDAARRLAGFGIEPEAVHRVVLAECICPPSRLREVPWQSDLLITGATRDCVSALIDGLVVVVAPDDACATEVARAAYEQLSAIGTDVRVAIGNSHAGAPGIRASFLEARQILARGPGIHVCEALGLSQLVMANTELPLVEMGTQVLRPILEYDAAHDGQLLATLETFLANDCSPSESSAALFIHRNTLRYRLQLIERLTSRNLSSFTDRVNLWVALLAYGGTHPARPSSRDSSRGPAVDEAPASLRIISR